MPSSSAQNSPEPSGLLRILLSAFSGVLFGLFLSKLKAPIQESVSSISPKAQTDSTNRSNETDSPFTRNVPPTPSGSGNSCKCCHHKTPWWKILLEVGMLLATAGAFGAAGYYAHISKKMWGEMQIQTKTAQRQLEQSQRPWLTLELTVDSGLQFAKDGGVQIRFRPHIKNIGNFVATNVMFEGVLFLQDPDNGNRFFDEPTERQNDLCDKIAKTPLGSSKKSDMALVIFPNSTDESLWHGFDISKSEIEAKKKPVTLKSGNAALIFPAFVGCVDYQYATGTQHHQTRFMYLLQWHDRTIPPGYVNVVAIKVGRSVDTRDVILQKWAFGGFDAY